MSTTNTKHTPHGAIALAYLTAELEHRLGNRTFSADNQREAAAADDDLRDLMTERESLAAALAAVTAQRDQCKEALERIAARKGATEPPDWDTVQPTADDEADPAGAFFDYGYDRAAWVDAEIARAALRACESDGGAK